MNAINCTECSKLKEHYELMREYVKALLMLKLDMNIVNIAKVNQVETKLAQAGLLRDIYNELLGIKNETSDLS